MKTKFKTVKVEMTITELETIRSEFATLRMSYYDENGNEKSFSDKYPTINELINSLPVITD